MLRTGNVEVFFFYLIYFPTHLAATNKYVCLFVPSFVWLFAALLFFAFVRLGFWGWGGGGGCWLVGLTFFVSLHVCNKDNDNYDKNNNNDDNNDDDISRCSSGNTNDDDDTNSESNDDDDSGEQQQ